jgi:hypothetical protein
MTQVPKTFTHRVVYLITDAMPSKVNGDQGRLGGLLKLWLVERAGQGAPEIEVRRLLDRLGELQTRLAEIAGRV